MGKLEPGKFSALRLDKFRAVDRERLVENLAQLLREDDSNGAGVLCVNWNRKCARIAIVPVDRAFRFPHAVSVTRGMVVVTHKKDFRPKILVQSVLGLDRGQIIARGNDAPVEHNEIVFAGRQNNSLLLAAAQGYASEKNGAVVNDFGEQIGVHGRGRDVMGVIVLITPSVPFWEALFTARSKFAHYTQAILPNSIAFYGNSRHLGPINLLIARRLFKWLREVITLGKANFHRKNCHR